MKCTWENCDKEAVKEQYANDGSVWADLCVEHAFMMEEAIEELDAKKMLSYWIRALGGAKKAAKTMM